MSDDDLMRVDAAAQFLGTTKLTLYHWVSEGRVPVIRISKRCIRFRKRDLEAWLDKLTTPENH